MATIKKNLKVTLLTASLLASLGLSTAGCGTDGSYDKDFFPSGERQANKIANAQAAAGARSDASLSSAHFDGGALNSLGQMGPFLPPILMAALSIRWVRKSWI